MRVALIGGTGLVGGLLVRRLLAAGDEVHALQRRSAVAVPLNLHEHVALPADWPRLTASIAAEAGVSALGTTMRQAGSEAAFRAVDHDMVLAFARAARAAGARRLVTVSSVGADPGSGNFYLRLKGRVEEELKDIGFDRLDIVRPGLLRGPRGGDRRRGERIAILVSPLVNLLLRGPLDRYAGIDANLVAGAIVALLQNDAPGVFIHCNRDLHRLAGA